ncbi:MAG TPA: peptide chain release factor N(5)-glutamine methyltransferase [Gemmatimonadales bacterium]|nr:peptide chain release factor N(5)-glutamine methyltransferase [Gemmatimonadales bacterium]
MKVESGVAIPALLAEATTLLMARNPDTARRTAARILGDLLGTTPAELRLDRTRTVCPEQAERFLEQVRQVAAGAPLEHVTGVAGFRHLELRSDARGLIPRPETEGLVGLVLERIQRGTVADIGTGSGAIALALAAEGAFDVVVGVDSSADALALARENAGRTGLGIELVEGHLASPLAAGRFDAVVSNPPYLTASEYSALEPAVREYEPRAALESGVDGLAATRELLDDARRVLRPGGWLALEIDATRGDRTRTLAEELGWHGAAIHLDLFGRERYLLAQRSVR